MVCSFQGFALVELDDGVDPRALAALIARLGAGHHQAHGAADAKLGSELSSDTLAAIDEALGDAPVKEPTLAPAARSGITYR
jgi:hypothetical protein